ncbi:hypothetical protein [Cellulomonas sp. S1-8]|uniref:hypothetical protein n=1 Tax=Cellulomonas sp. S1-8 TaxID=2904790 RepID=UPI0022449CC1|nr:hypothetical protein [Cellulomonas sp. S1-8]UZN01663.1 hypothetical protein OKX07_11155 [Cellulomonas sp. S1-8]
MDARPDDDTGADDTTGPPRTPEPSARPSGGPDDDGATPAPDVAPPTLPASDDDAWAAIVAQLSDVGTTLELPAGPGADGGADTEPRTGRVLRRAPRDADAPPTDHGVPAALPEPTGRDWDGTSQYGDAEDAVDDLEHFVPQDPGPVLGGEPLLTLAWGAAAAMPLLLLVIVVAWQDAPALLVRAAAVVFVVAVAILVWRMPQRRDPSDDDGAVV